MKAYKWARFQTIRGIISDSECDVEGEMQLGIGKWGQHRCLLLTYLWLLAGDLRPGVVESAVSVHDYPTLLDLCILNNNPEERRPTDCAPIAIGSLLWGFFVGVRTGVGFSKMFIGFWGDPMYPFTWWTRLLDSVVLPTRHRFRNDGWQDSPKQKDGAGCGVNGRGFYALTVFSRWFKLRPNQFAWPAVGHNKRSP